MRLTALKVFYLGSEFMLDIVQLMYNDASAKGIPVGGTFELTPLCNMNCRMCYIRMSKEDMDKCGKMKTAEEWLNIAKKARERGLLFLLLTGGEPFLYPEFWELYEGLKKMGIMVSINSNATMLSDDIIDRLIKNPPQRINVTIYGGSDETYKELCRYENGFTKATEAVRKLRNAGICVKINGSITPLNCSDIPFCFQFAKEVETPLQLGSYMFPPMRREDKYTCRFEAEEAGYYQAVIDKMRYEPADLEKVRGDIIKCNECGSHLERPPKFRCRAGRSSFWINWKGEMHACGMMENFKEYPFEKDFGECWDNIHKAVLEQTALTPCSECEDRDVCKVCPAIAFSETGSFNEKPEYLCRMTRKWKEEMLK